MGCSVWDQVLQNVVIFSWGGSSGAGAARERATVPKKLANVGHPRNAGIDRRVGVHIIHRSSEGKDCQDYADGTGSA